MTIVRVGTKRYEVEAVVFDKDGLLFDSQHFWKCLAKVRLDRLMLHENFPGEQWCEVFGVQCQQEQPIWIDPNGIFALASPQEEIVVTASMIRTATAADWGQCRQWAVEAFRDSDHAFELSEALLPKPGFPAIFQKLADAGIPYGIATSDDEERTRASIKKFADIDSLKFIITPADVKRGKPNPDMLWLASECCQTPLEKMLMIGDSFVDVLMAKQAGCIGIGIPDDEDMSKKMEPYASCILSSLEEIEVLRGR
ncbi:HAD family hydrolase [Cohnella silvisoli]|uniref:HAD family hydrolase n=1 Tax=Cohnella silvisoli TaxID=2873699 RepID=A0ABV1KNW7_9BACL|nr:HAD family hydrolase [Cohnella silvisoli]MCD9020958.1 HAD family hydrolase [Cohnella silvisoli]